MTRILKFGNATITLIYIGDIYLPLAKHMNIPESELEKYDDIRQQERIPIQFAHIQLPEVSVLVDAGIYDVETHPEYAIDDYVPPASLVEQLIAADIQPDTIDHVVITHRHWDHFNGTTVKQGEERIPQYPNATYHIGKADWDRAEEALQDPNAPESQTLKVLHRLGKLMLIDGETEIADGVTIIPTPGETRGHQIVRFDCGDAVIYCLGDLYHHEIEFVDPEWMVSWARPETTIPSRKLFTEKALADNAYLLAGHITDIGRLVEHNGDIQWEAVTDL